MLTLIKKHSKHLAWYSMSSQIEKIHAREILDSRGNPTIEADVCTCCGFGCTAMPSGATIGTHESLVLCYGRDIYNGKGILNAVENVNEVKATEMPDVDALELYDIDQFMIETDGTPNKSNPGVNAIIVSLAIVEADASSSGMPLYKCLEYMGGVNTSHQPISSFNSFQRKPACQQRSVSPGVHGPTSSGPQ
jgi:enolase